MNKSQRARLHNGLLGHIAMASRGMASVIQSPTTTNNQKEKAENIWLKLADLERDIRNNRVD